MIKLESGAFGRNGSREVEYSAEVRLANTKVQQGHLHASFANNRSGIPDKENFPEERCRSEGPDLGHFRL